MLEDSGHKAAKMNVAVTEASNTNVRFEMIAMRVDLFEKQILKYFSSFFMSEVERKQVKLVQKFNFLLFVNVEKLHPGYEDITHRCKAVKANLIDTYM